jgi:glyoxylase-like metal-dependent hydrolase (beta-lactamase superfamily II)
MVLYARKPKVLFSGDIVFPDGYYGRYDGESGSIEEIIYSLKKLTELDVDILLSGHGRPIFTDGNKHIQQAYQQASRPR